MFMTIGSSIIIIIMFVVLEIEFIYTNVFCFQVLL